MPSLFFNNSPKYFLPCNFLVSYGTPCSIDNPACRMWHDVHKLPTQKSSTLLFIALFKLLKGVALLAVGIGALRLLHRDIAQTIEHWVDILRVDPDNRFVHSLLERVLRVNPHQLKAVSAGTFVYSALLLTEGTGLLLRKRWAEYFTIITTAGLIPLELYELAKHVTAVKIAVLAINVAIVVYLVVRVREKP